jgi:lysozyme
MVDKPKPVTAVKKGTLASVIGIAAAALVMQSVPEDESGRHVKVTIAQDGTAAVQHVRGPQYLRAYLDIAGIATACDGITKGVKMGQVYTEAQCAMMLERELVIHAQGVMNCTPGLRPERLAPQRAAAVSLAYNIGVAGFCKSTAARRFNAGDYRGGCEAFKSWNKARVRGVLRPVQGLTNRRTRERAMCLKGTI